jgi:uncharacterized protein
VRVFYFIILAIPLLSLTYWVWAHAKLRRLGASRAWHLGTAITLGPLLIGFVWIMLHRSGHIATATPPWLYAAVLLWGIGALPFIAVPIMTAWSLSSGARFISRKISQGPPSETAPTAPVMSRRQMIGTTAVALPMIATLGTTAVSIPQKRHFRVRDITVHLPDLPPQLDGVRIAHISDTHVGKFTRGKLLHQIADATNELEADLVLLTGDLIDNSLDDLPEALDMIERIHPRSGLFTIEGNHDLFHGVEPFATGVRDRGIQLLRDQSSIVQVRGRPLQIMGISWHGRGEGIEERVDHVADQRDPDAFPILLAHHPHAFDRAADRGIPLTLAGHTHGGQVMLTPEIGPGPMMWRYWSGLYQKGKQAAIISNGTGNWFPLRTAAPAEIIHIILRRGAS